MKTVQIYTRANALATYKMKNKFALAHMFNMRKQGNKLFLFIAAL